MDSPWAEKATQVLIEGRKSLIDLLKFVEGPSNFTSRSDVAQELVAGVSRSLDYAIHLVNSGTQSGGGEVSDGTHHRKHDNDPVESCRRTAPRKDRRGCYKRRKKSDSSNLSASLEDGYAWRKYGQKYIHSHIHPRCYFRCTHKSRGCKATKQVQRWEKDESLFQTTYFEQHTCSNRTKPSHINVNADTKPTHDDEHPYIVDFDSVATPTSVEMDRYPLEGENDVVKEGGDKTDAMNWSDLTLFDLSNEMMLKFGLNEYEDVSSGYDYGAVDMDNVDLFLY